jgi:hypothetical protein
MAASAFSNLKIVNTTTPQTQKIKNRQNLESSYYDLAPDEFVKMGDVFIIDLSDVEKKGISLKLKNPILVIEAKFLPRSLCAAANGFDKKKIIVHLKPPYDSYLNRRIIEVYKRKITRDFLEVNLYLGSGDTLLAKYDIQTGK